MKIRFWFTFGLALCGAQASHAGFHGDVNDVRNTPGYIESNSRSNFFQGVTHRRDRDDGVERRSPSEIILSFFQGDHLDTAKLAAWSDQLKAYDDTAYLVSCQTEIGKTLKAECDQDEGYQKKWKKDGYHLSVKFARKQLEAVIGGSAGVLVSEVNDPKNQGILEKLFSVVEIWEAVKGEDEQRGRHSSTVTSIINARGLIEKNIIASDRPDSSNLLVPATHPLYGKQTFLSEKNLNDFKTQGGDLSLLDPPSTGMWRKPKKAIREFNTANTNEEGMVQLLKLYSEADAKKIIDPDVETVAIFKLKVPDGGKSPKFDVEIGKVKWKLKYITDRTKYMGATNIAADIQKLAWGSEANAEPVVNNLAAAMGFTIDPTYFKKKVRVYFEDKIYEAGKFDESLKLMSNMLEEHFGANLNVSSGLQVVKTDNRGRKYIEVKSVSLELKANPDTDLKLGSFDHIGLGKDLFREHRAFSLFLAFICDLDVKNENDAVKVVPSNDGYKVMDSNSDMGNGLAEGYPNIYNFPFIRKVDRDQAGQVASIQFNYPRYYELPMLKIVNVNDARWFARLLGQLTPAQIETAFLNSGFVPVVAKYFALIVGKKRNELLKALDLMGTSFKDGQGNTITLNAIPEFTGTIAGYEHFFKDGLLSDPQDELFDPNLENWPRHWGVSRRLFSEDEKIDREIRMMLRNSAVEFALQSGSEFLNRAVIHNHNDGFEFSRIIDHRLGMDCGGDCFIEGADFGLQSFVPLRYLISSPALREDPTKPLWIVDVMRIGFFAGDRGEALQGLLGFEVPSTMTVAVGGRVFKIYEIIKVTPISGMSEYFDETKNFFELPRYALRNLRDQVFNNVKEGESLLISSYTGAEAQARINLTNTPFFSIRMGGSIAHVDRTTVNHAGPLYSVNWAKGEKSGSQVQLNLFDQWIRVPLVKQSWGSGHNLEATFSFQDSGSEKALLLQNLVHPNPDSIPDQYKWEKRRTDTRTRHGFLSFLGLLNRSRFLNKIETHYENFREQIQTHTKKLSLSTEISRIRDVVMAKWKKTAEVLVNDQGKVALTLNFDLKYPSAEKEKLLPILQKYHHFFPSELFFFDTQFMKHYLGDVDATATTFYNQEMLEKLFDESWTAASICAVYAPGCSASFYRHYESIRKSFNMLKLEGTDARDRFYKRMARFFLDHDESVEFAKVVLGEAALVQDAQIDSSLSGFPGDQSELAWRDQIDPATQVLDPKIFSDRIQTSLNKIFFAPITE